MWPQHRRRLNCTTSTCGGQSFQAQKTDTTRPPSWPKSTRIQVEFVQTCIDQLGAGVAETSFAQSLPSSKTTRPPSVP
ncbi:hypothetical protein [Streptomyces sp. BE133]|uniref:hypothetical protein n=1 Tax=Streptomyces sp. BE133 TaxID=3002523 RepID=UPI002E76AEC5|nr:hypothetical protein [Streptomyces sp. BE133]